jgi:hypothetical protein
LIIHLQPENGNRQKVSAESINATPVTNLGQLSTGYVSFYVRCPQAAILENSILEAKFYQEKHKYC